jgi:putative tricarboxylic transport membrane protein
MTGRGTDGGRGFLGPRIVAAFLVAGGALLIYQAFQILRGGGYSVVGPGTIPLAVAIGLLGLGLVFALRTTALPDQDLADQAADEERATHWTTVGLVVLMLVAYGLALNGFRLGPLAVPGLGYVLATTLFLPATARALGSTALIRDVAVGVALAIVIYVGFTQYLGVRLPAGLLDFIL